MIMKNGNEMATVSRISIVIYRGTWMERELWRRWQKEFRERNVAKERAITKQKTAFMKQSKKCGVLLKPAFPFIDHILNAVAVFAVLMK